MVLGWAPTEDIDHMRCMRIFGTSLAAGTMLLTATVCLTASLQSPSGRPIPLLSDTAISAIQDVAKRNSFYDFAGLADYAHGARKLYVTSNRATIAYKTALAALKNAQYNRPPSERQDAVHVECGDPDLRDAFECSRVRVLRLDRTEIRPLSYAAEPHGYTNSSGDRWTVREVYATYLAEDMSDGFLVEYLSVDGVEGRFEVSPADARDRLLLKLANEAPRPVI